jgi:hypothetical protein
MDIASYLSSMSNEDLISATEVADKDLRDASTNQPNTEWHECCMAGVIIFAQELSKRGLKINAIH